MARSGWFVVGMGVLSVGLGLACGDDLRSAPPLEQEHPLPGGSAGDGGGVGGGGGTGGAPSRASSLPLHLPLIEGFAPGTVCESNHWCWYNPTPVGTSWLAAAAAGPHDIWIAGVGSNGLRFDGHTWSVFQTPLFRSVGIWAASPTDIWIVGWLPPLSPIGGVRGAIAHGDGQTFQLAYELPETSAFKAVWGSGPNDVWATSLDGVFHFDGQRWTKQNLPAGSRIVAGGTVDGSGPDDVWIGSAGGLLHFDGTSWTVVPELDSQSVRAVAARARDDVWVSALKSGTNTIYHFDGASWTSTYSRDGTMDQIASIDARAPDDAWAVGSRSADDQPNGRAGLLLHWNGTSWVAAPEVPYGLSAVLSLPDTHIAVGDAGQVFELSTTAPVPSARALNPSPAPRLQGIWGSSPSDMWAVGSGGAALHYDGVAVREEATGVSSSLLDVWGSAADDVWAVGEGGVALRRSIVGDAPSWTRVVTGTTSTLEAVFTAARDDVWIGGQGGLLHWDGLVVSPVAVPGLSAAAIVHDVHGLAPDDVWAAGDDEAAAFVSHYDGASWSPAQTVAWGGGTVGRIWMVAPNDVWGDITENAHGPGDTWHFDGTSWSERFAAPAADRWMFPVIGLVHGYNYSAVTDAFSFSRDDVWAVWQFGSIARMATSR